MGRYALLIGISNYNAGLTPLPSAVKDVDALQEVLLNPEIGGFAASDVTVLRDAEKGIIEKAIYHLFADRKNDDLLMFYFSGHGVTDSRGDFYLTGLSTSKDALPPTAVSSNYVHSLMNQSRSKRQVVILDCCHSGAFSKGAITKGIGTVNVLPKLGGEGRAILTASDSSQYAFAQEGFELSLYTHFLVEGLKTGAADRDGDGDISVDELYDYVRDKVKSANDNMSPEFHPVKEGYRIVLAKAAQDDPKLKFRKEVEIVVSRSNGKISTIARNLLNSKSQGIALLEVEAIINEVLRPYQEYAKKLEGYEQILLDAIAEEFPFSEVVQIELQEYENHLGLREGDVKKIKDRLIAPRILETERLKRQQEDARHRQKESERTNNLERYKQEFTKVIQATYPLNEFVRDDFKIFQQSLELSDRDIELIESPLIEVQEVVYQQKQADKAEKQRKQIAEAERLKLQKDKKPKSNPSQNEFEFEIVKILSVTKEGGFIGIGGKTKVELERKKGKAQYIREDLGNGVTLDLVRIPAGKFMMGSNEHSSEQPVHEATLREFWMGKYAVTNAQWQAVMGTKPSEQYDAKSQGENRPVVGVSRDNAKEFCLKASQKTGKPIRLPSETEWEYACRAGTTTPFHFGEKITDEYVSYGKFTGGTCNVENFSPNAWGLYQMHGNIWEWCEDVWHENYNGIPQNGSAWLSGGEQSKSLLRGGTWLSLAFTCRSANRHRKVAGYWDSDIGFRVVASVLS